MATNQVPLESPRLAEEAGRIRDVYEHRTERGGPLDLYGLLSLQERQRILLLHFRGMGLSSLRGLNILDVGCGAGSMLRYLTDFGAEPERCVGIDLLGDVLRGARRANPTISFLEGNAARLPFADHSFHLVLQSTVLSSVLDEEIRRAITGEMLRTLRPHGHVVWYDLAYSNPANANVRGISRGEIRELFPNCSFSFYRVTPAPPLGRVSAGISATLCRALWLLPFLRTHSLCFARKSDRHAQIGLTEMHWAADRN